jgi:methionyl-tRNA synthetase
VETRQGPGDEARQQLDDALYASAETLRIAVALLHPILPESTAKIWAQLGMTDPLETSNSPSSIGATQSRPAHRQIAPVFPRIDAKSAIERMRALEEEETAVRRRSSGRRVAKEPEPEGRCRPSPKIDIDDFVESGSARRPRCSPPNP